MQEDNVDGLCKYFTTISTAYACSIGESQTNTADSISIGSLICIIFGATLTFYCIVGYIINGYKRNEWKDFQTNLPHCNSFWRYLPSLVTTGCIISKEYISGALGSKSYDGDTEELYDKENDNL